MPRPVEPAAEPAAHPGQGRRDGAAARAAAAPAAIAAAVGDEDGDVVGPALRAAARPRRSPPASPADASASSAPGAGEHRRGRRRPAGRARRPGPGAAGDGAVGEQHERGALLEHVLGDLGRRRPGRLPSGGRGVTGQERRAAVGVHDQRRRVTGGGVGEPAGAGVEHAVEDRGALDVVHLAGEGVQGGEHRPRRRVAQRGRAHGPAQPAHRAGGGHAVPDGVADHEGDPARRPAATASYQSPPAARADGGPVVAARQPEVGQHRQGRRQQRELGLLDDVGGGLGHSDVSVAASSGSSTSSTPGPPATRIGRTIDRRRRPVGRRAGRRASPAARCAARRRPRRRPAARRRAAGRPGAVPSARARALAQTGSRRRRRGSRSPPARTPWPRPGRRTPASPAGPGTGWQTAGAGAHLGSANTSGPGPGNRARPPDVGPWRPTTFRHRTVRGNRAFGRQPDARPGPPQLARPGRRAGWTAATRRPSARGERRSGRRMVDSRGALAQDGRRAERLELRVPTTATQLPAVRAMAGDLAMRMDYDLDAVEDLRLAVDEACATLRRDRGRRRAADRGLRDHPGRAAHRGLGAHRRGHRRARATASAGRCWPPWSTPSTPAASTQADVPGGRRHRRPGRA